MTYTEILEKAMAEEITATRLYVAAMAIAPAEDIGTLLELNKDETDHIAIVSTLLSKQTGQRVDYATMVSGVD